MDNAGQGNETLKECLKSSTYTSIWPSPVIHQDDTNDVKALHARNVRFRRREYAILRIARLVHRCLREQYAVRHGPAEKKICHKWLIMVDILRPSLHTPDIGKPLDVGHWASANRNRYVAHTSDGPTVPPTAIPPSLTSIAASIAFDLGLEHGTSHAQSPHIDNTTKSTYPRQSAWSTMSSTI